MEGSAKFVSLVVLIVSLVVYWYKRPVEDMLQVLSYVLGVYQKIMGTSYSETTHLLSRKC